MLTMHCTTKAAGRITGRELHVRGRCEPDAESSTRPALRRTGGRPTRGSQFVGRAQPFRDLCPVRRSIKVDAHPPTWTCVRRHEITIRRSRDQQVLRGMGGFAPHGVPSGAVVIGGVREAGKHPLAGPEGGLAVGQFLPRVRQGKADAPQAIERATRQDTDSSCRARADRSCRPFRKLGACRQYPRTCGEIAVDSDVYSHPR